MALQNSVPIFKKTQVHTRFVIESLLILVYWSTFRVKHQGWVHITVSFFETFKSPQFTQRTRRNWLTDIAACLAHRSERLDFSKPEDWGSYQKSRRRISNAYQYLAQILWGQSTGGRQFILFASINSLTIHIYRSYPQPRIPYLSTLKIDL